MSLCGRLLVGQLVEQPVHGQVGIAADGRGEVAVVGLVQGVVAFGFRPVDRLLHAPQDGVVHGRSSGRPATCSSTRLISKRLSRLSHGIPSSRTNEVKSRSLVSGWRRVNAPQEQQFALRQVLGHRFVGRQHELFDDLMAGVVFDDLWRR